MHIVVTEPYMMATSVRSLVESLGSVSYGPFTDQELANLLSVCDILMVRLGRYVGREVLHLAPKLRYIVSATTGLDHIDLAEAQAAGIRVISLRDCMGKISDVSATAEHTWGLLLALIRATPAAVTHVLADGWDRNQFWGWQLKGKTLGIVGHGRIGGMVARYGAAFGMDVLAHDIDPSKISQPAGSVSLAELARASDVISIHVTAIQENCHLIDRDIIWQFKQGAFFLNTSRGMLVDSEALAEAVVLGRLAGVAVDVLEGEERNAITDDPLLACAKAGHNVLITPHIGGATRESIERAEKVVVEQLKKVIYQ